MRVPSARDILKATTAPEFISILDAAMSRFRRVTSPALPAHSDETGKPSDVLVTTPRTFVVKCFAIIFWTIAAFVVAMLAADFIFTPIYTADARILLDIHAGADSSSILDKSAIDAEIQNQIQILTSRNLARAMIKINKLSEIPEFDPVLKGVSPGKALASLIGIGSDPFRMTPEERILTAWYDRLKVYAVGQSSVIAVEFKSRDPELAKKVAQSIANGYAGMPPLKIRRPGAEIIAQPVVSNIPTRPDKFFFVLTATLLVFFLTLVRALKSTTNRPKRISETIDP